MIEIKKVKIKSIGNGYMIYIPKAFLKNELLNTNDNYDLIINKGEL